MYGGVFDLEVDEGQDQTQNMLTTTCVHSFKFFRKHFGYIVASNHGCASVNLGSNTLQEDDLNDPTKHNACND